MIDVSIIFVNYKTAQLIVDSINSIKKYVKDIRYEIIVVDNNSGDNFNDILHKEFNDDIICISLSSNIGFGQANNEGVKIAKGRNIFFLNPDTLLLNNAVKILSDYLDNNQLVGVCGGNLYNDLMLPAKSYCMVYPSIKGELNTLLFRIPERLIYGKNVRYNTTGKPLKTAYIMGADLMVKRNVLNEAGLFSDKIFLFYEEVDLCLRIKKKGYKIKSIPLAKIQHLESKSFGSKMNKNRLLNLIKGRHIFYSLHYSSGYIKAVNYIYLFILCIGLIAFCITSKKKYKIVKFKKKIFLCMCKRL